MSNKINNIDDLNREIEVLEIEISTLGNELKKEGQQIISVLNPLTKIDAFYNTFLSDLNLLLASELMIGAKKIINKINQSELDLFREVISRIDFTFILDGLIRKIIDKAVPNKTDSK